MESAIRGSPNPEYQVILLIIDGDDGRMYPLTEDRPKCLLPFANKHLLSYQLELLDKCGATEVFIVANRDYQASIANFLSSTDAPKHEFRIEVVYRDGMSGSADGLREVADRIRGDFIIFSGDVLTDFSLGELVSAHRLQTADVTMLLAASPIEEVEAKTGRVRRAKIEEEDEEFVGLGTDGRIVLKTAAENVGRHISLSKPMLEKCQASITVRRDLIDVGVYCCSHWVLEFVQENADILSIRSDLLPYLIRRQFLSADKIIADIPSIEYRRRPLKSIEPFLVSSAAGRDIVKEFSTSVQQYGMSPIGGGLDLSRIDSVADKLAFNFEGSEDILRCFALVSDDNAPSAKSTSTDYVMYGRFCQKISSIQLYMNLNRVIPLRIPGPGSPIEWNRVVGYRKKENSTVSELAIIDPDVVLKRSCVFRDSRIGANSKVSDSIIMDSVQIGANCTIQNSVLCVGAVIEADCNLVECVVGSGSRIALGSKLKSEVVSEIKIDTEEGE